MWSFKVDKSTDRKAQTKSDLFGRVARATTIFSLQNYLETSCTENLFDWRTWLKWSKYTSDAAREWLTENGKTSQQPWPQTVKYVIEVQRATNKQTAAVLNEWNSAEKTSESKFPHNDMGTDNSQLKIILRYLSCKWFYRLLRSGLFRDSNDDTWWRSCTMALRRVTDVYIYIKTFKLTCLFTTWSHGLIAFGCVAKHMKMCVFVSVCLWESHRASESCGGVGVCVGVPRWFTHFSISVSVWFSLCGKATCCFDHLPLSFSLPVFPLHFLSSFCSPPITHPL